MTRFRDEMDRLFERFFEGHEPFRPGTLGSRRGPALNVWQDAEYVLVETELPGFTEEDLTVTVTRNELAISGERKTTEPAEGTTIHRHERGNAAFSRVVHLPVDIDPDGVAAEFRNGVLTIALAKAEATRPRRIEVTSKP